MTWYGSRRGRLSVCAAVAVLFAVGIDAKASDLSGNKALVIDKGVVEMEDTSQVVYFLAPGVDAAQFAQEKGLGLVRTLNADQNAYVFEAGSVAAARQLATAPDPRVQQAFVDKVGMHQKMAFTPNDPYFNPGGGFPGQWHLVNQMPVNAANAGLDVNITGAWNNNLTGNGVIIGIVDDSFETAHPDLAPNYNAANSWDFGQNDNDPNPVYPNNVVPNFWDEHGVSVAGVAGGRGGNGIGVTGAAPYASMAGLRLDFPFQTQSMFAAAISYNSSGSNTNIDIKNHSYGYSAPYISTSLEDAQMTASVESGTIHTWSAGNNRGGTAQDSNKLDNQNHYGAITVAALGSSGKFATYSNFGANVFVTAPTSSFRAGEFGITTTDRTGLNNGYNWAPGGGDGDPFPDLDYTTVFGGTSSSAPLVAGILALAKQAQPNLDTRFAKHLLAMTSVIVDATDNSIESDGGWRTNAAGYTFNQNYGFGLIDATALTNAATQYVGVTPLETAVTGTIQVGATVPDNNLTGITRNFNISGLTQGLEEVLVTLNISHTWRGDLEAILTSPSGTTSRLMIRSVGDSGDNINWQFLTNMFWGENGNGTWSLNVRDVFSGDVGFWNSFSVIARAGSLVPVPEPSSFAMLGLGGLGLLHIARRRRQRAAA